MRNSSPVTASIQFLAEFPDEGLGGCFTGFYFPAGNSISEVAHSTPALAGEDGGVSDEDAEDTSFMLMNVRKTKELSKFCRMEKCHE